MPNSKGFTLVRSAGFTLVELLVVISIIAILSVVGVTVFGGVQKNARDSRRKADIDAIAKAIEVNYSVKYQPIKNSWFGGGGIPQDPLFPTEWTAQYKVCPGTNWCTDCYVEWDDAFSVSNPGCANTVDTYPGDVDGTTGRWAYIREDKPTGKNYWMICANLESPPQPYCRRNQN